MVRIQRCKTRITIHIIRQLTSVCVMLFVSLTMAGCGDSAVSASPPAAPDASPPRGVSALGRLEPMHGIIVISSSSVPEAISGAVLVRLLVDVGDDVKAGQLLAVTDTAEVLEAKVDESRAAVVRVEKQALAGRNAADATSVRAGVLQREADRLSKLLLQNLAAEEETDRAQGAAEAAGADCTAARSAAAVAEADIDVAGAHLRRQEKELVRSQIYAPVNGKVLAIKTRPGELIGIEGILELGQVDKMYAIAEVYESDVSRLRNGQRAIISSPALPDALGGQIERIRPIVRKQDEIGTDPAARKDARIVEVEILLDSSESVSTFTHLQVDVDFEP